MITITREPGETFIIGDDIKVSVLSSCGDVVKFAIDADRSIPVYREEIYHRIKQEEKSKKNRKTILRINKRTKVDLNSGDSSDSGEEEDIFMKYGAKNQLVGTVREIKRGTVMSQVNLDIPGPASMSSVLTVEALDDLDLKEGDEVRVIVKAVNVLLAKE